MSDPVPPTKPTAVTKSASAGDPPTKPKPRDANYDRLLAEAEQIRGQSLSADAWRRLRRNRVAMTALVYLGVLVGLAAFTYLLPLQSPREVVPKRKFQPPTLVAASLPILDEKGAYDAAKSETLFGKLNGWDRLLLRIRLAVFGEWAMPSLCGTDQLGRDVLARLFHGARVSLAVAFVATLVSLAIGVSYGAIAGYAGGWIDNLMMRVVDVLYSIPFIFVVIFLITILNDGPNKELLAKYHIDRISLFFLLIGAIYWLTMARVVRGQVLSLKQEQFVEAARACGASHGRIVFFHLVPNVLGVIIVYLTLTIPNVMLFESFLSFLGLGVEPPEVSWGLIARDGVMVITPIEIAWWVVLFPALALGLTLLALNFLGDGLRDALDPRLREAK